MNKLHRGGTMRLPNWDYQSAASYFVTICTKQRLQNIFGEIQNGYMCLFDTGKIIYHEWLATQIIRPNVKLDQFIVMPDHIHAIITITHKINNGYDPVDTSRRDVSTHPPGYQRPRLLPNSLGSIINQYKSISTKKIRSLGHHGFQWQPRYYEHIIRSEQDLKRIRTYIKNNPANWAKH